MITPEDIWQQAQTLSEKATQEIEQREAIKTMYYSVLHKIDDIANKLNLAKETNIRLGSHEKVIARLYQIQNEKAHSAKMIINFAKRMKQSRVEADYDLKKNITPKEMQQQQKYANECWHKLNQF